MTSLLILPEFPVTVWYFGRAPAAVGLMHSFLSKCIVLFLHFGYNFFSPFYVATSTSLTVLGCD